MDTPVTSLPPMTPWPPKLLNNGLMIPGIGFGTSEVETEDGIDNLGRLIREGVYRHIDTAFCYWNEDKIGRVLSELFIEGAVTRNDVFVTTKVWRNQMHDVEGALRQSLAACGSIT